MSERTSYAPGTPSWVELSGTPDIEASVRASTATYSAGRCRSSANSSRTRRLPAGEEERQGRRRGIAADAGGSAARSGRPTSRSTMPRRRWRRSRRPAASVIAEPMDVMGLGTMASSPTRPVPSSGSGSPAPSPAPELVNEPGAFAWNELGTRDTERRQGVLRRRLRLGLRRAARWGRWGPTRRGNVGEELVGGMIDIAGAVPDEIPAHWLVYFAVEDTDATLETGQERRRRRHDRPDRHPGRPLRDRHRPARRRLRGDRSATSRTLAYARGARRV